MRDQRGNKSPRWKGGRLLDKAGYILIWKPEHPFCNNIGYVREHRLIYEGLLGRYLRPEEIIHHRNGKKDDNRLKNLELTNPSDHASSHSKQDLRARRCDRCGRRNTYMTKCKYPTWFRNPFSSEGFYCNICYNTHTRRQRSILMHPPGC